VSIPSSFPLPPSSSPSACLLGDSLDWLALNALALPPTAWVPLSLSLVHWQRQRQLAAMRLTLEQEFGRSASNRLLNNRLFADTLHRRWPLNEPPNLSQNAGAALHLSSDAVLGLRVCHN
jgi:hypothetical protein